MSTIPTGLLEALFMLACIPVGIFFLKVSTFIWGKWFSSTLWQYYTLDDSNNILPVTFVYRERTISLRVEFIERKDPAAYSNTIVLTVFYLNDKPVMSFSEQSTSLFSRRWVSFNPSYDTEEVFKMLKVIRRKHTNDFLINRKAHRESRSIY